MPVFIQHTKSNLYIKTLDEWTQDIQNAADFSELNKALRFCREFQFEDVHIVIKFFSGLPDWIVTPIEFRTSCSGERLDG